MKTALKIVGGFFTFVILICAITPFFVDVDKYRPVILEKANTYIHGNLTLGKLSFSLWGKVKIAIDGLELKDAQGLTAVKVQDASFVLPFSSILSGSPELIFQMNQPEIFVKKNLKGDLSLMGLVKKDASSAATQDKAPQASQTAVSEDQKFQLPMIVVNSRFGAEIRDAKLVYEDEKLKLKNTIDHLNLRVRDVSLSRTTSIEMWADLNTQMGTDLALKGPLRFEGKVQPELTGSVFKGALLDLQFSANDLEIKKGTLLQKSAGIPLFFTAKAKLEAETFTVQKGEAGLHTAVITMAATSSQSGAEVQFELKPVDLKSWNVLIPMLSTFETEGKIEGKGSFTAKTEGATYQAHIGFQGLSAKGPGLKAKPVISGSLDVATDRIEQLEAKLTAPGNDLTFKMKLSQFAAPKIDFRISSQGGMDLDQWIEFPRVEEPKSSGSKSTDAQTASPGTSGAPVADRDATVDPIRSNDMLKAMVVKGGYSIPFVKAKGNRIDALTGEMTFQNLVFALSQAQMKMFDGMISGSFSTDLKPKAPTYQMAGSIKGLNIQKSVETQFPAFRNTLLGLLSAQVTGSGASFNPDTAKKNLNLRGDFSVKDGSFKTIDVMKMVNDATQSVVEKAGEKVPALKGKKLDVSKNTESKYESISANYTIQNGVLKAPNFFAKAAPNLGLDLKGNTEMGLIDQSLTASWEIIDTYRMTPAHKLSFDLAGKTIRNPLAKSEADPFIIPVQVSCKWSAPCPNYQQTGEYLVSNLTNRVSKAAGDVAKDKAKAVVEDAVKKVIPNGALPPKIQEGIQGGLKKLFGN